MNCRVSPFVVRDEVGEVLSWSSSSSELITKGASWVAKGVASLALFLWFGPHSSSSFLILLSYTCLEEWEGQGPDIRPSALGLYFLVGLGDQLLLLFRPCLPAVLLRLIPLCVFCCANLLSLSLVTLLGCGICSKASSRWMKSRGPWLLLSGL